MENEENQTENQAQNKSKDDVYFAAKPAEDVASNLLEKSSLNRRGDFFA